MKSNGNYRPPHVKSSDDYGISHNGFAALEKRRVRLSARNSLYRDLSSSLASLPRQAFILYIYCFLLVFILSLVDFLRPFAILGMFLGLVGVYWSEANRIASTTSFRSRENEGALLVEVEMDTNKDISGMLRQLEGLEKEDIVWMYEVGSKRKILPNETLIHENQPIDALYIILSGTFEVSTSSMGRFSFSDLRRLSLPGFSSEKVQLSIVESHIIGEMSFIREESYLPSATVKAIKESWVWSIPRSVLRDKLNDDSDFSSRFYKLISIILAKRLDSSNKLRGAIEGRESKSPKALKLFTGRRKPLDSYPLTNLTPGMLLFMIDSCMP